MTTSVFATLPPDWQAWIRDNLARACSPRDMADSMARSGQYSMAFARAAIGEALGADLLAAPGRQAGMPQVDTTSNRLAVAGRAVEILCALRQPRVVLLGNVLDEDECDAIVAHCDQRYTRSTVTSEEDGASTVHDGRTSEMAVIQRGEHALADRIEQRLAAIAQWPLECGEPFQLQKYGVAQQYRPHYDWLNPDSDGHRAHLRRGGQRLATFILYLSDVEQGGGTAFPNIGLEVFPRKGSALFFLNTDASHRPDQQTLHAGCPVVRGTKIIANKWLRESVY
ncbi:prolyl hydroxylase family protein [Rugamonas apoptosis]|uniref:2OG-Fe(II) oxygenase n=1 Tax=Rugamonas apoptosis TaxID=2758570 RepID=A0A7W2FAW6_9BURK|nr:2OG-Fe(II) oxygenase [Rugamonas apoptosis]MBA5688224.1 2OG-Fe(II) oxygenase [Rugamonas apoptosis]